MPDNAQVRTDSDRRQFLQMALSESVEQSGGNFNKAIGDLVERFDEGASNLSEYFVQGGVAFRLRPSTPSAPPSTYAFKLIGSCGKRLRTDALLAPCLIQDITEHQFVRVSCRRRLRWGRGCRRRGGCGSRLVRV
jgi:hypothetical protein